MPSELDSTMIFSLPMKFSRAWSSSAASLYTLAKRDLKVENFSVTETVVLVSESTESSRAEAVVAAAMMAKVRMVEVRRTRGNL